jgi:hypothetical protein
MSDKSTIWIGVALAFFAGLVIGFVVMRQRAIGTMEAYKLVSQRQMQETKQPSNKQSGLLTLGRVYILEGGQLMQEEANKTLVAETVTLGNGATLTVTGLITRPDGTTAQLEEGESVLEDGSIMEEESEDSMMEKEDSKMQEDSSTQ